MKTSLHNFDLELIKASIPTECQSHSNSLTPVVKMAEDFSLYCDYKSSSGAVGGFLSPHIVPTFTQLGYSTASNTEDLSGQSMAGAGGIVPPSIGITEQISGVCIFAVFGGGPTFAVMNRSLVFFAREEGQ